MECAGFVLAGGMSSRMGRDKARLEYEGEALVARAVRKLGEVCADVAIAGGVGLEEFGRVVPDEVRGCGPLGGIVAALEQSEWEWNLFLPVDVPLVPVVALRELMGLADAGCVAVLTETEGRVNPLCGVYSRRALPVLREELAGGRLKVRVAVEKAGVVRYWKAPVEGWFRNCNTPEEFAGMVGGG